MGVRTDGALAMVVLLAASVAFVLVDASVSVLAVVAGGLGTIAFEVVAMPVYETVRQYWERPLVQAVAVVLSLLGIGLGAVVAASFVLSFVVGALVTYLGLLVVIPFVRGLGPAT